MQSFKSEDTDRPGAALESPLPTQQPASQTRRHLLTGALGTASVLAAPAIVQAQTSSCGSPSGRRLITSFTGALNPSSPQPSDDWSGCFQTAAESGVPVEVPPGVYRFNSFNLTNGNEVYGIYLQSKTKSVDFMCSPNAEFRLGSNFDNKKGGLFRFINDIGPTEQPVSGQGPKFSFTGGYFNGEAITAVPTDANGNKSGLGMISVAQYADPVLSGIRGYGGKTNSSLDAPGAGFMDTFISTHGCLKESITNIHGRGFYDSLLYITGHRGDDLDGNGKFGTVRGLVATHCGNGIAIKRNYLNLSIIDCSIWYCQNGVFSGAADGSKINEGKGTRIIGGSISRIRGIPITVCGENVIVENVSIGDFGLELTSPRTLSYPNTVIAAIDLKGCTNGRVTNNHIVTRSVTAAGDLRRGILLRASETGAPTKDCLGEANEIVGPPYKITGNGANGNNVVVNP